MVNLNEVERQLKQIGQKFRFWGRPEILELRYILIPGEQIQSCINGRYSGGFATLCATDQRILLIDKKPMYLTFEDIRYDMIAEVDYSHRLIDASINICTPNKNLIFTTWHKPDLRVMTSYLQQRVMEIRYQQHYANGQAVQAQPGYLPNQPISQMPNEQPEPTLQPNNFATNYQNPANAEQLPTPGFMNPYTKNSVIHSRKGITEI